VVFVVLTTVLCKVHCASVTFGFDGNNDTTKSITLSPRMPCIHTNTLVSGDRVFALSTDFSSNGTGSAVIQTYVGYFLGYMDELANTAHALGYEVLIIRVDGDITQAGFTALRVWSKIEQCVIPTYLYGGDDDALIRNAKFIRIQDTAISEVTFNQSVIFIMCFTVPSVILIAIQMALAIKKIIKLGFPQVFNVGTAVCLLAVVLGIFQRKQALLGPSFCSLVLMSSVWCNHHSEDRPCSFLSSYSIYFGRFCISLCFHELWNFNYFPYCGQSIELWRLQNMEGKVNHFDGAIDCYTCRVIDYSQHPLHNSNCNYELRSLGTSDLNYFRRF
jgi:hypothetical protein